MTKDDKPISTEGVQPDLNAMHIIKPGFSLDLNAMDIPSWERAKSRADSIKARHGPEPHAREKSERDR